MTKDEALKLALEALEGWGKGFPDNWGDLDTEAITAIKEALAQPEPVKIAHKHEWFRTGEMKVGQMRCISCGTWGQEEIPQRTWVTLTEDEVALIAADCSLVTPSDFYFYKAIESKLKEKNT